MLDGPNKFRYVCYHADTQKSSDMVVVLLDHLKKYRYGCYHTGIQKSPNMVFALLTP